MNALFEGQDYFFATNSEVRVCERPLGLWDICFKSLSSVESFKESFAARSARSDTSSPSAPNQLVSDKYSYNDTRKPVISAKKGLNEIKMTLKLYIKV